MVYCNTRNTTFTRLLKALSLIDWSKGYTMGSIGCDDDDEINNFVKDNKIEVDFVNPTKWYRLPQAEAVKFVVK